MLDVLAVVPSANCTVVLCWVLGYWYVYPAGIGLVHGWSSCSSVSKCLLRIAVDEAGELQAVAA
jgi:hypothetical protein